MVTKFGKFCRNLRMDNGELLYHMAERLGVSSAFLSRVENGKAKPPAEWKGIISAEYKLNTEQIMELEACVDDARTNVIKVDSLPIADRDLMFAFARQLENMDTEEKDRWKKMLKI